MLCVLDFREGCKIHMGVMLEGVRGKNGNMCGCTGSMGGSWLVICVEAIVMHNSVLRDYSQNC